VKYRLRLTEQAKQDLREIWRGLAEFSGLQRADDRLQAIRQKFRLLEQFPKSGRSREELMLGIRSTVVYEFVIFYRVIDPWVEVVRVIHGRRDIETVLQEDEPLI
jgi:toxin ParE1/3/4